MLVMKPHSEDLRTRTVAAVEAGMPKPQAARLFGVSLPSVKRYCRKAAQKEPLAPRKGGGRPPKLNATIAKLPEGDVAKQAPLRFCAGAGHLAAQRERGEALCVHREEAPA